jgi:hypothetical protein
MSAADLSRRLVATGTALAVAAEGRTRTELAARATEAFAGSDVAVRETDDETIELRGRALRIRAFGSRRRAPDARFAGLLATLARGDAS